MEEDSLEDLSLRKVLDIYGTFYKEVVETPPSCPSNDVRFVEKDIFVELTLPAVRDRAFSKEDFVEEDVQEDLSLRDVVDVDNNFSEEVTGEDGWVNGSATVFC